MRDKISNSDRYSPLNDRKKKACVIPCKKIHVMVYTGYIDNLFRAEEEQKCSTKSMKGVQILYFYACI